MSRSRSVSQVLPLKYIYFGCQSQRSGLVFVPEICLIILRSLVLSYYALLFGIVSLSLYQDVWDEFVIDAVIDTNSHLHPRSVLH